MPRKDGPPWVRFWSKVSKNDGDGCWEWTGVIQNEGYGRFWLKPKMITAHRFSYELHHGAIKCGALVLHRCDNPKCVRPDHLFLGTPADNMQDMLKKDRKRGIVLSVPTVKDIKRRLHTGECYKAIARDLGVTANSVYFIKIGKTWATIQHAGEVGIDAKG